MKIVQWHEAAEDELLNEVGYLELQAPGLGRRFFAEMTRVEGLIGEFPRSRPGNPPRNSKTRAAEIPIFIAVLD